MSGYNHYNHCDCGWCRRKNFKIRYEALFRSGYSYINPNALCPICKARVYYYENHFGSRVFFDDLGWPWPKHPCTDKAKAQSKKVPIINNSTYSNEGHFLNNLGLRLDLYVLRYWRRDNKNKIVRIKFDRVIGNSSFQLNIKNSDLQKYRLNKNELTEAPSFAVRIIDENFRQIEFISVSKKEIIILNVPRS